MADRTLRIRIDDGRQVWTPAEVKVPADASDDQADALLVASLREIADAVDDEHDACTCGSTCRAVRIHEFGTYSGDEQHERVTQAAREDLAPLKVGYGEVGLDDVVAAVLRALRSEASPKR